MPTGVGAIDEDCVVGFVLRLRVGSWVTDNEEVTVGAGGSGEPGPWVANLFPAGVAVAVAGSGPPNVGVDGACSTGLPSQAKPIAISNKQTSRTIIIKGDPVGPRPSR